MLILKTYFGNKKMTYFINDNKVFQKLTNYSILIKFFMLIH